MDVFVSRPTWISSEFEEGLTTFYTHMRNLGLVTRTLGVTDHPSKSPLDEVISILDTCQGAIILGYPQIVASSGMLKGSKLDGELHLATEWNHIEAALAYSMRLPLLIIHHETVSRGIFDRGVLNAFIHRIDLTLVNWSLQTAVNGAINNWKSACSTASPNFLHTASTKAIEGTSDKPICPNCSTNLNPVFMRPVPPDFVVIAGGEWECTKCKYVE